MICSIFAGREYNRYVERRIGELDGFVAFLNHAKSEISMYLTPAKRISRGFQNEILERLGFLSAIESEGNISRAFLSCYGGLSIGKEAKELLSEFFSEFGQGYREQELARIDRFRSDLEKILERDREELPKNARMVSTLLLAGALGIFILLL